MTLIQDTTITLNNHTQFDGVSFRNVTFVADLDYTTSMNISITYCDFDSCNNIMEVLNEAGAFDWENPGLQCPNEPRLTMDRDYNFLGNLSNSQLGPCKGDNTPQHQVVPGLHEDYEFMQEVLSEEGKGEPSPRTEDSAEEVIDFNNIDILTGREKY